MTPISLQDFFTFDLFDLLILIPGVHHYIPQHSSSGAHQSIKKFPQQNFPLPLLWGILPTPKSQNQGVSTINT